MDFINLKKQYQLIKDDIDKDVLNIFEKSNFILGEEVLELEEKLANYVGVSQCITCASGTDALLIPLMAYGFNEGDAIFTTNFSYFATAEVISLVNATPVFVDIEKQSFNISPEMLEIEIKKVIKDSKLKPKAIIAVDLFGQLANYEKLKKIAQKYSLILIEDAAQSFGASVNTNKSCSFGDVSATSFYPAKPLGCYGDGGAIFTNDTKLADLCRSIRVHGQGKDKYNNIRIGLNSRLDTIQAAVLLNKLKIFEDEIYKRNQIATFYSEKLKNFLLIPNIECDQVSSWAQYSLLCKDSKERKLLIEKLKSDKIPTAIFYREIFSKSIPFKKDYKNKIFLNSEDVSSRIFSIPMHPYLNKKDLNIIIESIIDFFKN